MNDQAYEFATRQPAEWKLRTRTLALGSKTLIMGIVNITPDSFSDGGLYFDENHATAHALELLDEGADILDLGAESTRPGSDAGNQSALTADEEQSRLLPVLEAILKARPKAIVSADTYKAATARQAIAAGAEIINDVSGLTWDASMAQTCASLNCGLVMMHTRGRPDQWRTQPRLQSGALLSLVREGLATSLETALAAGIASASIVLDPGYGFGKRFEENYRLLARQSELLALGRPLLAGLSRKSFLAHTVAAIPSEASAETASIAALTAAILNGASIVRVHAVRPAVEAAAIADAINQASRE